MSQGIAGTINYIGNIGKAKLENLDVKKVRVRPVRRIDLRGQIRIYNEDLAILSKILQTVNRKMFKDQQIRFFSLLPTLNKKGEIIQYQKSILMITNMYIVYLRVYNFLDLQDDRLIEKSLFFSEKLENIMHYDMKKLPGHVVEKVDEH